MTVASMNVQSRLITKPTFKSKRSFFTDANCRAKLLEQATPHLWRICSGYSLQKIVADTPRVAGEQKFTGLHFMGDSQFTFYEKPIKSWVFLGGRRPNRRGELEEVTMGQQTKRDHWNHYTGLINTKDNYLQVVLRKTTDTLPQNFSDTPEKSLMKQALQIAKIKEKDHTIFLSSNKEFAAVSSREYRIGHHDMPLVSVSCDIVDLKNNNICYSPSRGRPHFHSAQFSPSNAFVFFTAKDAFSERVSHTGFLSLAQKGQCTFNVANNELDTATISPHGQHILANVLSWQQDSVHENIILRTIEHMTQTLSEEQLAFIAQLPMADHLYDHKIIEQRTDTAVRVIFPKNTHIPVNKTLLKEHDQAVFLSLPKELQRKIMELYNIEVSS